MLREEELMKELCNEMGIEWVEGKHEPMINGIPCGELDMGALLDYKNDEYYAENVYINQSDEEYRPNNASNQTQSFFSYETKNEFNFCASHETDEADNYYLNHHISAAA